MITREQIRQCKDKLLERQMELITWVEQHQDMHRNSLTEEIGELASFDNHPADLGTELYEREKNIALVARAEKELTQINEALHAIEAGTYGICKTCGMPIPLARLLAVPMTDTCKEHAIESTFIQEGSNSNYFHREDEADDYYVAYNLYDDFPPEEESMITKIQKQYDAETGEIYHERE